MKHRRRYYHYTPSDNNAIATSLSKIILPSILIIALIAVLNLAKDTTYSGLLTPHNELVTAVVGYAVLGCEIASVIIIVTASMYGLYSFLKGFVNRKTIDQVRATGAIRLRLGHHLSLALEFAMAADILSLAISPNFTELVTLFIIVLIRVLITTFLEYDIEYASHYHTPLETNPVNLAQSENSKNKN